MNKIIAVAIDDYDDPTIKNLNNCIKDLNSLIDILSKKYEFDLIELYSKKQQTTLSFLYNELYNELINSLETDNLLIIFAGHGEFNPTLGTSYWLCSDSHKQNVTSWFNVNDLIKFFNASPAKHIALISDSCFSGAIFENYRGGGLNALDGKKSREALTSGGLEKVKDGKINENSPFNKTLLKVLNENTLELISFRQLSEKIILGFSPSKTQTPSFGSLINSGDKGGTLFLKMKSDLETTTIVKPVQIPLDISNNIKIDSSFEIPFFNKNKYFQNDFINAFVQQLGYSIINDIRVFVTEDENYSISRSNEIEFYLDVGFSIETLNEKFLSVVINRSDYFGGAHPNHYIYSISFAFKPERKLSLEDILDYEKYKNIENYLIAMIDKYGEPECNELLKRYSTFEYINQLDFSFNDEHFTIYYMNLFPHAYKACGYLEIPINNTKFRI